MSERKKDLTGQKFGRLTAIESAAHPKHGYSCWRCRCDCGNEHFATAYYLLKGTVKSCGCARYPFVDLKGKKFGNLTVVEFLPEGVEGKSGRFWRCICGCGNEAKVIYHNLVSGQVKSCGCLSANRPKDLTGKKFGLLTVIKPAAERKHASVTWLCQCDCGNEATVTSNSLTRGKTKSCGCLRSPISDLSGKKFGRLTAIKHLPDAGKDKKSNNTYWHCICECGNEVIVASVGLCRGSAKSCGCLRSEMAVEHMKEVLKKVIVEGTHLGRIKNREASIANKSTGVRGVYMYGKWGKYRSSICFQGKNYNLGVYEKLEDAIAARKAAEAKYFDAFLEQYYEKNPEEKKQ